MLKSLSLAAAVPYMGFSRTAAKRYPIAFSTLGCPKWEWKTILGHASEWGYAAIELRGIMGEMDLTKRPELIGDRLKESLKDLAALDLKISDLGSSSTMHEPDAAKRAKQIEDGKRFIDLAQKLKAPYVRVFGDKLVEGESKQATIDRIISGLQELGRHARGSGVQVIMETHGDFPDSPTILRIVEGANMPEVALLWDTYHTYVVGKEQPADTIRQLGKYVRHVHLKDSVSAEKESRYVLTGTGKVPVREIVLQLAKNHYAGYYCYEWEKVWHPEIEEPEIAFPHYAKTMSGYLADAGL
jgi:sugar phosphate isomerase/epimerase